MSGLRKYEIDTPQYKFYKEMHEKVDLDYTLRMRKKYSKYDKCKMSIKKALSMMDDFIDPSDPDLDVPNSIHAYQTAERARKRYPEDKELQIAALIHDLGKVLFSYGEPNYSVVGDTYVVGYRILIQLFILKQWKIIQTILNIMINVFMRRIVDLENLVIDNWS